MAYSVESDTMGNKRVHHRSASFLRLVRPCFGLFEADSRPEVRTPQLSSREASQINNSARRGDPWRSGPFRHRAGTVWVFPGGVLDPSSCQSGL